MTDAHAILEADREGYILLWLDGAAFYEPPTYNERFGPYPDMSKAAQEALLHRDLTTLMRNAREAS